MCFLLSTLFRKLKSVHKLQLLVSIKMYFSHTEKVCAHLEVKRACSHSVKDLTRLVCFPSSPVSHSWSPCRRLWYSWGHRLSEHVVNQYASCFPPQWGHVFCGGALCGEMTMFLFPSSGAAKYLRKWIWRCFSVVPPARILITALFPRTLS